MTPLESHHRHPRDAASSGDDDKGGVPDDAEIQKMWRDIYHYESILRQQTDEKLRRALMDLIEELKRQIDKARPTS